MKLRAIHILALIAGVTIFCGCVDSGLSAVRAFDALGMPIEKALTVATSPANEPKPNVREYTTPAGVRVVVVPDSLGCEIHYFVNASGIVSGYMFVGDRCTTYEGDRFSERVVIPTRSTVD